MARRKEVGIEVISALTNFPYFVLKNEIQSGYNTYLQELRQIKQFYIDYQQGAEFYVTGTGGDYVGSSIPFKLASTLINKEARFMFSQTPLVEIKARSIDESETERVADYQTLVDEVMENCNFPKLLLQSAKDCLIGKRIACLIDFSEDDGIQAHFYNSLQFYYETDYGSERLTKFVSFEQVTESKSGNERKYLVNRYEEIEGDIHMSSVLYTGRGTIEEVLIPLTIIDLDYIPAVIITNDGTLENKKGISEMEQEIEYESGYSKLANADIDSEHKGMNPIRVTVDMSPLSTANLSSGAGSYWDLKHDTNMNEPSPQFGTLAPSLQHTEAVKTTLDRIKTAMYSELDVPNITEETMVGAVTSGKALRALYYPLTVRCDEKMKTWIPALKKIVRAIIDIGLINQDAVREMYQITGLQNIVFDINIKEQYALLEDETEEKETAINEVNAQVRSRFSYIKQFRKSEFNTDEQIEQEVLRIAMENNLLDSMSLNAGLQTELNKNTTDTTVQQNIDDIKTTEKANVLLDS